MEVWEWGWETTSKNSVWAADVVSCRVSGPRGGGGGMGMSFCPGGLLRLSPNQGPSIVSQHPPPASVSPSVLCAVAWSPWCGSEGAEDKETISLKSQVSPRPPLVWVVGAAEGLQLGLGVCKPVCVLCIIADWCIHGTGFLGRNRREEISRPRVTCCLGLPVTKRFLGYETNLKQTRAK